MLTQKDKDAWILELELKKKYENMSKNWRKSLSLFLVFMGYVLRFLCENVRYRRGTTKKETEKVPFRSFYKWSKPLFFRKKKISKIWARMLLNHQKIEKLKCCTKPGNGNHGSSYRLVMGKYILTCTDLTLLLDIRSE